MDHWNRDKKKKKDERREYLNGLFFLLRILTEAECVIEGDVHSLSPLINIIRMQLRLVGATRMSDLFFFFSSFIIDLYLYIYEYVYRVDNRWRLRDATDLIEEGERERNDHMCLWGRHYYHYSAWSENKRHLPHFLVLYVSIVYKVWTHERMYTINKTLCMFPRCVFVEHKKKREKKLSVFLYRERMSMVENNMDCGWEKEKKISIWRK